MKKGFTLIEVLIVVFIIALLAPVILISINSARTKARDGSFKSTAASLNAAAILCCNTPGSLLAGKNIGDGAIPICNPNAGTLYPDDANIGQVNINQQCDGNGNFILLVTPGTSNEGNCASATVAQAGVVNYMGC